MGGDALLVVLKTQQAHPAAKKVSKFPAHLQPVAKKG